MAAKNTHTNLNLNTEDDTGQNIKRRLRSSYKDVLIESKAPSDVSSDSCTTNTSSILDKSKNLKVMLGPKLMVTNIKKLEGSQQYHVSGGRLVRGREQPKMAMPGISAIANVQSTQDIVDTSSYATSDVGRIEDLASLEGDKCDYEESLLEKRGKGRPPITGKYAGIAIKKLEAAEKAKKEESERRLAECENLQFSKGKSWEKVMQEAENIAEDLRLAPASDVLNQLRQQSLKIYSTSIKAGNLKGGFMKILNRASSTIMAATNDLSERLVTGTVATERTEIDSLTRSIQALREENVSLRRELEQIKSGITPAKSTTYRTLPARESKSRVRQQRYAVTSDEEVEDPTLEGVILPSRSRTPVRKRMRYKDSEPPGLTLSDKSRMIVDDTRNIPALFQHILREMTLSFEQLKDRAIKEIQDAMTASYATTSPVEECANKRKSPKTKASTEVLQKEMPTWRNLRETSTRDMSNKMEGIASACSQLDEPKPLCLTNNGPVTTQLTQPLQWSEVVGRKSRRKKIRKEMLKENPLPKSIPKTAALVLSPKGYNMTSKTTSKATMQRRVPKTAAVSIKCPSGTYKEVMSEARKGIRLDELQIDSVRTRKALNGALILEISGEERVARARALANRLQETIGDREGVKIDCPTIKAELRVRDLEDSITQSEIAAALATAGECSPLDIKVGEINYSQRGMNSVWVQCPVSAANKLAKAKMAKIGWNNCRLKLLPKRPLQCFTCLEKGHISQQCSSAIIRSNCCYKCGQEGHLARYCDKPPNCPVCRNVNLPYNHKIGSTQCNPPRQKPGIVNEKPLVMPYKEGPDVEVMSTASPSPDTVVMTLSDGEGVMKRIKDEDMDTSICLKRTHRDEVGPQVRDDTEPQRGKRRVASSETSVSIPLPQRPREELERARPVSSLLAECMTKEDIDEAKRDIDEASEGLPLNIPQNAEATADNTN